MKANRKFKSLKDDTHAGIAVYVFILFGLSIMMYLFGFTNMWSDYSSSSKINTTNVSDPRYQTSQNSNPLNMIITFLTKNQGVIGVGLASIVVVALIGWFTKTDLSAFYMYIIPIGILAVFLNTVVFPIYPISDELAKYAIGGLPISIFLVAFFNLWFILAVVEYVRSGVTS